MFEGTLAEAQLKRLHREISRIIVQGEDAIMIYRIETPTALQRIQRGVITTADPDGILWNAISYVERLIAGLYGTLGSLSGLYARSDDQFFR